MSRSTLAVVLTPPGRGAVATVRVEGPRAVECVERCFTVKRGAALSRRAVGRIALGRWTDSADSPAEEVVACRLADDCVEVHCHGGTAAVAAVVDALTAAGCEACDWTDWVRRHEPDEVAAEAQVALAQARTLRTASILLDQFAGALAREVAALRESIAAGGEADALARLRELLDRADLGCRLTEPFRVVLAGPPNVGKSSLINALAGFERALVFDQPGTTRDVVTTDTALDGWPVELSDTAGLRQGADALEAAGVDLAESQLARADVVVLVFDRSLPWDEAAAALAARRPQALVVHNKSDLPTAPGERPPGLATSAVTGAGLPELIAAVAARLVPEPPPPGAAVPFTARQRGYLQDAETALQSGQLADADTALAAVVGQAGAPED